MPKSAQEPLIEYRPKLLKLSNNEKQVLEILSEVAKLIIPIYKQQENSEFPGANFYPHDATKEEIRKAANKDPQILSPYTVVEREGGELVAIPYHIKYADLLKPIATKLKEAAKKTTDKEFGETLMVQARTLLDGSYEKATAAWLKTRLYVLDISIGPNDYFDDQLFHIKNSYQAWVGVLDKERTKKFNNYKSTIQNARRKALILGERVDIHDNVKVKVIDTVLFSGLMARTKFQGVNYPINIDFVEKYGSEITLFNQPNDRLVQERVIPVFNTIFSKEFKEEYSIEDLRRGNLRYTAMHEFAHSYLYYRNASENLQDLFRAIYELAATLLGFRMAGALLLKDRISNKQFESMIVAYLCGSLFLVNKGFTGKFLPEYTLGATIFINFLWESGALKNAGGMAIPNFMKIFVALQDLFHILELLLSTGTREKAEVFIKQYGRTRDFLS